MTFQPQVLSLYMLTQGLIVGMPSVCWQHRQIEGPVAHCALCRHLSPSQGLEPPLQVDRVAHWRVLQTGTTSAGSIHYYIWCYIIVWESCVFIDDIIVIGDMNQTFIIALLSHRQQFVHMRYFTTVPIVKHGRTYEIFPEPLFHAQTRSMCFKGELQRWYKVISNESSL